MIIKQAHKFTGIFFFFVFKVLISTDKRRFYNHQASMNKSLQQQCIILL